MREASRWWTAYNLFLSSPLWKTIVRPFVLNRDGYRCLKCGNRATDVHHLRYDLGWDNPEILQSLCRSCHVVLHPHLRSDGTIAWPEGFKFVPDLEEMWKEIAKYEPSPFLKEIVGTFGFDRKDYLPRLAPYESRPPLQPWPEKNF